MDLESKEKALQALTRAETIVVAVSGGSGFDATASGLSIYLSCAKLNKNVSIIANPPIVEVAQKLYGVGKIGKIEGKRNLVIVISDAVDKVDKVTYSLEGGKLRVVVHPFGNNSITRDQIDFEDSSVNPDLIFSIGYQSEEQLRQEITHEQTLNSETFIINITKNPPDQKFAKVNVFNQESSSFSEICGQFLQELAMPIDEDIAYNLYSGIAQATSNFSPAKTSPLSFQIASWLVKFGAGKASLATSQPSKPPEPKPTYPPFLTNIGNSTPIEEVEIEKDREEDWLKPPKIYKGAKSFDREN